MLPSVELIDLTGLSTDDEIENRPNDQDDSSGEWEDVTSVIDLTKIPSDDEDEATVELARIDHAPTAPASHRQQRATHYRAETCELCNREARYDRGITRHHLYPQSVVKAAPKDTYTPEQKNSLALLCWPCHSAIHRMMTNSSLATSFHSIELLKANTDVQNWICKMQRASTAELDPPNRRNRAAHVAARAPRRKVKLPPRTSYGRPLPSQRPDEYLSRYSGLRRSARLAGCEAGASENIPDFGAYSASQVSGVKKKSGAMTKKQRKLARRVEKAALVSQINQALDTLWVQNGNNFPRVISGQIGKNSRLRDAVRSLCGNRAVETHEVRYVLRSRQEYREWYDWAFSFQLQPAVEAPAGALAVDIVQSPGAQGGHEDTKAMEGIQIHRENTDDRGALNVEVQEIIDPRIKSLEETGDYIPLW